MRLVAGSLETYSIRRPVRTAKFNDFRLQVPLDDDSSATSSASPDLLRFLAPSFSPFCFHCSSHNPVYNQRKQKSCHNISLSNTWQCELENQSDSSLSPKRLTKTKPRSVFIQRNHLFNMAKTTRFYKI